MEEPGKRMTELVTCPECGREVLEWISTAEGYVHCKTKSGWKKHKKPGG